MRRWGIRRSAADIDRPEAGPTGPAKEQLPRVARGSYVCTRLWDRPPGGHPVTQFLTFTPVAAT
jgi:hypothetical protein